MMEPTAALERLLEGNQRFVAGTAGNLERRGKERRSELLRGQAPLAAVLACADSRVPPELIFDQGLGDLFVVRTAGNIAAPAEVGSLEFAVEQLGVPLVMVLGHTSCGAIETTLQALRAPEPPPTEGLRAIVEGIRPAVAPLLEQDLSEQERSAKAVRENVCRSVRLLSEGSPVLARLADEQALLVVAAEYDLASGRVELFGGVPPIDRCGGAALGPNVPEALRGG
ncbi:MAG: carbonic anhydrase [Halorhodospira sp.]